MNKPEPHSHSDGTDEVGDNNNISSVHPLHCLTAVAADSSAGLHAARQLCGKMIADRAHLVLRCIILFTNRLTEKSRPTLSRQAILNL
jgi:hypothetical protein